MPGRPVPLIVPRRYEPHFQELVGFVKYQTPKPTAAKGTRKTVIFQMIVQAAWCRHQNVWKAELAESSKVRFHVCTTVTGLKGQL